MFEPCSHSFDWYCTSKVKNQHTIPPTRPSPPCRLSLRNHWNKTYSHKSFPVNALAGGWPHVSNVRHQGPRAAPPQIGGLDVLIWSSVWCELYMPKYVNEFDCARTRAAIKSVHTIRRNQLSGPWNARQNYTALKRCSSLSGTMND